MDFEGTIGRVAGRCPSVTFDVGGTAVAADASTDFKKGDCSDLESGQDVSGEGVTQPNGTIQATRIQFKKDKKDKDKG